MAKKAEGTRKPKGRGNGQGTVWEVRKGVWRWQVTLGYKPDGKRITASGTEGSKGAAVAAVSTAQTDHSRGLLAAPEHTTVSEYAEKWLARQHQLRPNSVTLYRVELNYALEVIGAKKVKDVRPQHIKDLLAHLARRSMKSQRGKDGTGRTMAPRTQAKVLTRLRTLFREAVADQIIYVSPMDAVKKPKTTLPESAGLVLDFGEAARLQELGMALQDAGLARLFPALFTAVGVGLRRGEVMGLTWDHLDLDAGLMRVRRQLTSRGETSRPTLADLKTPHSRRDIHLPRSLVAALHQHQAHQQAEAQQMGWTWRPDGPVFATAQGDWTHPDNLKRALTNIVAWSDPKTFERRARYIRGSVPPEKVARLEAAVRAGTKLPDVTPHDLRHTYATLALRRRVPVEVVSKTLGHARVSITLDIYRHVLDSERKEHVVDLFEAPVPDRQVVARMPN